MTNVPFMPPSSLKTSFKAGLLTGLMMISGSALAQQHHNHSGSHDMHRSGHHCGQKEARDAVGQGEIASYTEMLKVVTDQFKGRIIRVELENTDEGYFYQLRLLENNSQIVEVRLDARTLQILTVEGKGLENINRNS